jgi:hypothetical protein
VNEGRTIREGDIVVTRVARHDTLGRVTGDCDTQTPIETQNFRADALRRACVLAGTDHHVFLDELAGPDDSCIRLTCPESVD